MALNVTFNVKLHILYVLYCVFCNLAVIHAIHHKNSTAKTISPAENNEASHVNKPSYIPSYANSYSIQLGDGKFIKRNIELLSAGKSVNMSSYRNNKMNLAEYAVDGNYNQDSSKHSICAHTAADPGTKNPWLLVDLGKPAILDHVIILNRMDCCSYRLKYFQVLVSNSPDPKDFLSNGEPCEGTFTGSTTMQYFTVNCVNKVGQYVILVLHSDNAILHICEIEIYGEFMSPACSVKNSCDPKHEICLDSRKISMKNSTVAVMEEKEYVCVCKDNIYPNGYRCPYVEGKKANDESNLNINMKFNIS